MEPKLSEPLPTELFWAKRVEGVNFTSFLILPTAAEINKAVNSLT